MTTGPPTSSASVCPSAALLVFSLIPPIRRPSASQGAAVLQQGVLRPVPRRRLPTRTCSPTTASSRPADPRPVSDLVLLRLPAAPLLRRTRRRQGLVMVRDRWSAIGRTFPGHAERRLRNVRTRGSSRHVRAELAPGRRRSPGAAAGLQYEACTRPAEQLAPYGSSLELVQAARLYERSTRPAKREIDPASDASSSSLYEPDVVALCAVIADRSPSANFHVLSERSPMGQTDRRADLRSLTTWVPRRSRAHPADNVRSWPPGAHARPRLRGAGRLTGLAGIRRDMIGWSGPCQQRVRWCPRRRTRRIRRVRHCVRRHLRVRYLDVPMAAAWAVTSAPVVLHCAAGARRLRPSWGQPPGCHDPVVPRHGTLWRNTGLPATGDRGATGMTWSSTSAGAQRPPPAFDRHRPTRSSPVAGRVIPKGVDVLLRAWRSVQAARPTRAWWWWGSDRRGRSEEWTGTQCATAVGCPDDVLWLEVRRDVLPHPDGDVPSPRASGANRSPIVIEPLACGSGGGHAHRWQPEISTAGWTGCWSSRATTMSWRSVARPGD